METATPLLELRALEILRAAELEEARAIQSMMMPAVSLRAGPVTISHEFQPMAEVGGDFLDYFELTDGTIGFYLGDVCGKGLPAAMYAALVVGTLRGVHKTGTPPGDVLATLNRRLMIRTMPRRYVAIQYAVFDPQTSNLQIASAGMPGPFHLYEHGCRMLTPSAIPPGLFAGTSYEMLSLQLKAGDSLLFCTDGLTEAFDPDGEQFGWERVQALCDAQSAASQTDLLEQLFSAVENFSGRCEHLDDMAAALFHFSG
jgi:phosphoserine phosphatase RsbU/P